MHLIWISLWLLLPSGVIVLKNGKRVHCERYEQADGKLRFYRKGQAYVLPTELVDWPKTRQAEQAAKGGKPHKQRTDTMADYYADKHKDRTALSITNKKLKNSGGGEPESSTHHYREQGNNIVVRAQVNGKGPYEFILDTGASMSLVSPQLAKQLALNGTGQVTVHGVEGGAVRATTSQLASLAIGRASVADITVVIQPIPVLNRKEIVGLLGQDYLNHFVMNLDTANKTVHLKPHGAAKKSNQQKLAEFQAVAPELQRLIKSVNDMSQTYLRGRKTTNGKSRLNGYLSRLPSLRTHLLVFRQAVRDMGSEQIEPQKRREYETWLICSRWYELLLESLTPQINQLRRTYTTPVLLRKQIRKGLDKIHNQQQEYQKCMNLGKQ